MFLYFFLFIAIVGSRTLGQGVTAVTLKQECRFNEVHRSCYFQTEYTCWTNADRTNRVKDIPMRLEHCKSGCYCKLGLVREYPQGRCIVAASCRDRKLQAVLKEIPSANVWNS